jgi:hypothetical protein
LIPGAEVSGRKNMAKVKMLRNTVAGGMDVVEGKTYDLDESDALLLVQMGKAVPVAAKAKEPENRDDEPKTKRAKKK